MVDRTQVLSLPKGSRINFSYKFPGNGPYQRKGTVDRVRDLGEANMLKGNSLKLYGVNPVRPKGRVLVTMFDDTVGDYRSFYTEYMDNLALLG